MPGRDDQVGLVKSDHHYLSCMQVPDREVREPLRESAGALDPAWEEGEAGSQLLSLIKGLILGNVVLGVSRKREDHTLLIQLYIFHCIVFHVKVSAVEIDIHQTELTRNGINYDL